MTSIATFVIANFGSDIIRASYNALNPTSFNEIGLHRAYHFQNYEELVNKYNRNKLKLDDNSISKFRRYCLKSKIIRIENRIIKEYQLFQKYDNVYVAIKSINSLSERRNSI